MMTTINRKTNFLHINGTFSKYNFCHETESGSRNDTVRSRTTSMPCKHLFSLQQFNFIHSIVLIDSFVRLCFTQLFESIPVPRVYLFGINLLQSIKLNDVHDSYLIGQWIFHDSRKKSLLFNFFLPNAVENWTSFWIFDSKCMLRIDWMNSLGRAKTTSSILFVFFQQNSIFKFAKLPNNKWMKQRQPCKYCPLKRKQYYGSRHFLYVSFF